jgi:superfamily II DNA/RNA helicase
MQDETIPTDATGQTSTQSQPVTNSSFRAIVGETDADYLEELGFSTPTGLQERGLLALKSGKDATVLEAGVTSAIEAYKITLLLEKKTPSGRGSTLIVADDAVVSTITQLLEGANIPFSPVTAIREEDTVIVGNPIEMRDFFASDAARAMSIGRLILHGVGEQVDALRDVLTSACKRGRRPQLVLIADEITPTIQDLTKGSFQVSVVKVQHLYYDVGGELLAKPEALCDFIESEGFPSTLVFCTQPSDTDLVDVMLKKRGISSKRIVGHVAPQKVAQAISQVLSKEATALIVTDVSARNIEVEDFELIVNYSIPSDPEVYVHRTETSGGGGQLKKVISLVGPLDRAHFHYLKKIVESEFHKADAPSKTAVMAARLSSLRAQATKRAFLDEAGIREIVELLRNDPKKDEILAYLIHTVLNATAQPAVPREKEGGRDDRRRERGDRGDRGERGERGDRDRDRGDRDRDHRESRDGRERDRDRDRGGDREGRGERRGRNRDRGEQHRERDQRDSREHREEDDDRDQSREEDGRRREKRERRPSAPPKRTARLYLGKGRSQGLSEEKIAELLTRVGELTPGQLDRVSLREHYSFADIAEEVVDKVIDDLQRSKEIFVQRAITLTAPRDREDEPREQDEPADVGSQEESEGDADSATTQE